MSDKPLIRVKENKCSWTMEEKLYMPDIHGRRGIELFDQYNVRFVHDNAPADLGICKDGAPVQGVPLNKSILLAFEPPSQIPQNYTQHIRSRYLGVLSIVEMPPGTPQFIIPRGLNTVKEFFNRPKKKLLCIIGRDMSFHKQFVAHDLTRKRIDLINYFTERLGPERFSVYGRWPAGPCNRGELGPQAHGLAGYNTEDAKRFGETPIWDGKYGVLAEHEFTLALENSKWPGYLGCKAIEAQCSGSIPLYEGATDVKKFMTDGSYIDMCGKSNGYLLSVILEVSDARKVQYRKDIWDYLHGLGNETFSSVTFAKKLLKSLGVANVT